MVLHCSFLKVKNRLFEANRRPFIGFQSCLNLMKRKIPRQRKVIRIVPYREGAGSLFSLFVFIQLCLDTYFFLFSGKANTSVKFYTQKGKMKIILQYSFWAY